MSLNKLLNECIKAGYMPGLMYFGPGRAHWWATLHADWAGPKYETAKSPEKALERAIAAEKKT